MRLHSLGITAFGPFTETVEVNFDDLSEAGLFLLSGATGSGKTSVLDAVCFALYGEVPGDRNTAKRLRADQAPADVRPLVVLEVTVSTRRLRISRTPAWQRPKRRGHGVTTEQASVVVQELRGETWTTHTTRMDEAGHFISGLLRMTLTQFCQVALLPQGRFQSFLRARSEDRQQLLQQLFRTQRFADIEAWLAEHRRQLRRDSAAAQSQVAGVVNRLGEAAGVEQPPMLDSDLETLNTIEHWATDLLERALNDEDVARGRREVSLESAEAAESAYVNAQECLRLRVEHQQARDERHRLTQQHAEHLQQVSRLTLDHRAESLGPLLTLTRRSATDLEAARRQRDRQAAATDITFTEFDADDPLAKLETRAAAMADDLATLRALRPSGVELERLLASADEAQRELDALAVTIGAAEEALLDVDLTVVQVRAEHADATLAETQLGVLLAAQAEVIHLLAAHDEQVAVAGLLRDAGAEVTRVQSHVLALKEQWLEIRESRLNGMAAEIASALVVGGSCPVCGSADHPDVARPAPQAPDAAAERRARSNLDDAEAELLAFQGRHRELTLKESILVERIKGSTIDDLRQSAQQLADDVVVTQASAARRDVLKAKLAAMEARQGALRTTFQTSETRAAHLNSVLTQLSPLISRRRKEVDSALYRHSGSTIEEAVGCCESQLDDLRAVLSATREWCAAADLHEHHREVLRRAARALGFDGADEAEAAMLEAPARAVIEAAVGAYDDRVAHTERILESPQHVAAVAAKDPEVDTQRQRARLAMAEATAAAAALTSASNRVTRVGELASQLRTALTLWQPVLEQLHLAISVAALVDGSSSDNTLQMRLSGYVLAYRLEQVVSAANERLGGMTDQRYVLEHTARRGAGERRGGLSLLVRDDWSGESRDPATLSGGETFVVSLALALGLADVISHEVGGAELDTLFVDEGFGALDSETLDDVMDTLDSLRAGGRVVGIVSHVSELRHRIPTRLHVTKRRKGSTLALVRGI